MKRASQENNMVWGLFVAIVTVQLTGATAAVLTLDLTTDESWSNKSEGFMAVLYVVAAFLGWLTYYLLERRRRRRSVEPSRSLEQAGPENA